MRQSQSGPFPFTLVGTPPSIEWNMSDQALFGPSGGGYVLQALRTAGNTVLVQPNLAPLPNQKWQLLSVSINSYLIFADQTPTPGTSKMVSGILGSIVGGLILDEFSTGFGSGNPPGGGVIGGFGSIQPLPNDKSLVNSMWDPRTDAMPPSTHNYGGSSANLPINLANYLPIQTVIAPPVPLEIKQTRLPVIGIWMYPSLFQNVSNLSTPAQSQLGLALSTYSVTYDDGM